MVVMGIIFSLVVFRRSQMFANGLECLQEAAKISGVVKLLERPSAPCGQRGAMALCQLPQRLRLDTAL